MGLRNINKILFIISFLIAASLITTGFIITMNHRSKQSLLLIMIGLVVSLIYRVIGLYEVHRSAYIRMTDKLFWTIGFILAGSITALVYLFGGRNKVLGK